MIVLIAIGGEEEDLSDFVFPGLLVLFAKGEEDGLEEEGDETNAYCYTVVAEHIVVHLENGVSH